MGEGDNVLEWSAPGPGRWRREVAHFPRGQTPIYRALYEPASAEGLAGSLERYGLPMSHLAIRHVNDVAYVRLVPLIEPPRPLQGRRPPAAAVWLLSRASPTMRRRTRAARRAWGERRWHDDGRRWYDEVKPAVDRSNLALQDETPELLDDADLARHVQAAIDNVTKGIRVHFDLVAPNVVPVGALVEAATRGGVSAEDALSMLAGASPGSAAGVHDLAAVVGPAVRAASTVPRSLEEVCGLGGNIAEALSQWLRRYGSRVMTTYDVDQPALIELPDLVLRTVLMVAAERPGQVHRSTDTILSGMPAPVRSEVEDLLPEATYAYALRDDNASSTLNWPSGLLRRALLAVGDRLLEQGRVAARDHVFELHPEELRGVLAGAVTPSASDLEVRATTRQGHLLATAPRELGPEEPLPALDPLPAALRRVARAAFVTYELMETTAAVTATGTGIGETIVRGRARVAASAEQALALLEPGEILVVPFTTPAYNAVLPLASALVVEEGGPLSHAALVARELGVPAVIGLPGIVERIPDGSEVEVDPRTGTVQVVDVAVKT